MDTPNWTARVAAAKTEQEVMSLVQAYAKVKAERLKDLPPECQPTHLRSAADVAEIAYRLVTHHNHGDNARMVQSIGAFFSRAAVRLAELKRA